MSATASATEVPTATPGASYWALGLAAAAVAAVAVVAWLTGDDDVRWWLLVVPLVVTAAPVVTQRHRVRIAAAAILAVFSVITGMSVGMYFVPALLAAFAAATTIGRTQDAA